MLPHKLSANRKMLPNLSMLREYSKELRQFQPSHLNTSPYSNQLYRCIDNSKYQSLLRGATQAAQAAVNVTICVLADELGLDQRFNEDFPKVLLLDRMQLLHAQHMIRLDSYSCPHTTVPINCFAPKGQSYFKHPEGPIISLYLPKLHLSTIVEESLHFLQWFYNASEMERNLRFPRYNYGSDGCREETGIIKEESVEGSCLVRAVFDQQPFEEDFSDQVVGESSAEIVRNRFGFRHGSEVVKLSGKDVPEYPKFLDALVFEGTVECYREICKAYGCDILKDVLSKRPLSVKCGHFPNDLIHFLGYGLGEQVYQNISNLDELRGLAKVLFTPDTEISPTQKLDFMVGFYNRKLTRDNQ